MTDASLDSVSHQLRTPLTAIRGFVELVSDGDAGPVTESQREFLEIVARNAERLEGLIHDLLDLNRIESPGFELATRPVELGAVLNEIAATFRGGAQEKGLSFRSDVAALPKITGDRDRLTQLFRVLVSSAIERTPAGEVAIEARAEDGKVMVTVFEPGAAPAPALSLLLAKAIAKRHRGGVQVESERGKGTRFAVTLPIG